MGTCLVRRTAVTMYPLKRMPNEEISISGMLRNIDVIPVRFRAISRRPWRTLYGTTSANKGDTSDLLLSLARDTKWKFSGLFEL